MKRLFYLWIIGCALVACSVGDETAPTAHNSYDSNGFSQHEPFFGEFAVNWVVDNQITDTATLYSTGQFWLSRFPVSYLHRQLFPGVEEADIILVPYDFNMGYRQVGYSATTRYFSILAGTCPYYPTVAGRRYQICLYLTPLASVATYDAVNDTWSGLLAVDSVVLSDYANYRQIYKVLRYQPQKTFSFISTKRTR